MKLSITITIFATIILSSCSEKFQKLSSKESDPENLLKKIKPNNNVSYWQVEYFPDFVDETEGPNIIFSKGNYSIETTVKPPNNTNDWNGFFTGCQPLFCAYRIVYLENDIWKTAKSEEDLKNFIGIIDNEYEAFLIGKINDYEIDSYSPEGNGFIKDKNGYNVKMMKYNSCPESKESFTLFINNSGKITATKSNGFYLKSKNCIVY
ncbi:hypothetical protein [Chryseobacterium jejuense]|uniref:Lipoprotein n=1 Tax=Chryseobacterium jejuense TaxID=445960 RepID=A0A2X2WZ99_CHRJE|nr:hypothetical protein [Chryseobacterium jejuense]SDJ57564.1 hypothetical protein SAMN05421542_3860 [Chryseobacterium jejuense]SQB46146.1 Uncharacterised protein [Chryseobacterium jejuense]